MSVFWLSWYEPPDGPPGQPHPAVSTWHDGHRMPDGAAILCARVEADSLQAAWALADVTYPGCLDSARFEEKKPDGWWPPEGRYPRGARA